MNGLNVSVLSQYICIRLLCRPLGIKIKSTLIVSLFLAGEVRDEFSACFSHTWLTYLFCIDNFSYARYDQYHFVLLFAEKYNIEAVMSLNGSG